MKKCRITLTEEEIELLTIAVDKFCGQEGEKMSPDNQEKNPDEYRLASYHVWQCLNIVNKLDKLCK